QLSAVACHRSPRGRHAPQAARHPRGRSRRAARCGGAEPRRGRARHGGGRLMSAASPGRTWTVLELLRWTAGHFAERGIETARLDAELLLAHVLDCDRLHLYVDHD